MKFTPYVRACAFAAAGAAVSAGAAFAQLDRAVQIAQEATDQGVQNQEQVEQLDDARTDAAREYRAVLQQLESQRLFVDQQRVFLRSYQNEIESLNEQLSRVGSVEVELLPMMREMVVNLENFVRLDLPFQIDERLDRIERLKEDLDDAELTQAERYRVILNAYEIEASYGRGIDAYEGQIEEGSAETVDFLRVGRLMLIYREKDGATYGYWDRESGSWQPLSGDYGLELQSAYRIASEAAAPEILLLPIPGPEMGQVEEATFVAPPPPAPRAAAPVPPPPPADAPAEGEAAPAEGEEAPAEAGAEE